jgi:hypothetical protein
LIGSFGIDFQRLSADIIGAINIISRLGEISQRVELARRVLETLLQGDHVSTPDAMQLRNWALRPEDSVLTLEEIAIRILAQPKTALPKERHKSLTR